MSGTKQLSFHPGRKWAEAVKETAAANGMSINKYLCTIMPLGHELFRDEVEGKPPGRAPE